MATSVLRTASWRLLAAGFAVGGVLVAMSACSSASPKACGKATEQCDSSGACCSGLSCVSGVCACGQEGASCSADAVCCSGTTCDATGHCRAPCSQSVGACQPLSGACTADSDCCAPGTCHAGTCSDPSTRPACAFEGEACTTASDCCGDEALGSRFDCVAGTGGGNVCHLGQSGESCDDTHHCLPGLTCTGTVDGGTGGHCGVVGTSNNCTLRTNDCQAGDTCNPNTSANQGYDPCYYKVVLSNLQVRPTAHVCNNGFCSDPLQGQPCTQNCVQTAGDARKTSCLPFLDGSKMCMPACSADADCTGATVYDNQNYNPQPITNYCLNYASSGGSGCQPALCFVEGQAGLDDVSVLYKPCKDRPDTLCLPQYYGDVSTIVGFCSAVRPNAPASTIGQVCHPRAGREATLATCGKDAICLGGRCAAICDASQLGGAGTASCSDGYTCISAQNVNLIADYQVGGCGDPCDPFADAEHSGCANYCGGPPTRCNWIVGDPAGDQPRGFCGAALEHPLPLGSRCGRGSVDPCEDGARCLLGSDGITRTCIHLCDPTASEGSQDACPGGKTCTAFDPLKHSGYCQ